MNVSKQVTELIDKEAYPMDVINTIKILSLNKDEPAHIFGSYNYKRQQFAGDVDLVETDTEATNIEEAVNNLEKKLMDIFKKISTTPGYYFSEFKAGVDNRYDINVGKLQNGKFTRSNPVEFMQKIMILSNTGLIDKKDIDKLFTIYNKNSNDVTSDDYDIAFSILRNYRIIRWTLAELLEGKKKLRGNKIITLNEALYYNSPIKIDLVAYINNKFVEVTNFIVFVLEKDGQQIVLNDKQNVLTDLKTHMIDGLQNEIDKVFFSTMFFNPFKGIKRLWSLARQYGDTVMINFLNPIISGEISRLYQKKGDIDTIINVYEIYGDSSPFEQMIVELDNMKIELDRIIEFDIKQIALDFSNIVNLSEKGEITFPILIHGLEIMKRRINEEISYQTMLWLTKNNFAFPENYLPKPPKYYNNKLF